MSEPFCQELSLAIGEPLRGTAVSAIDRWLLLEHDGPWGARGLEDSELPTDVVRHLAALSARFARLRIQLIRRPTASDTSGPRLILAQAEERATALSQLALRSVESLLELPLEAWLLGDAALPGEPQPQPLYFVCVHGKRDRCCARLGMPVYRALEAQVGERVFQTTHLGGHRFAATLLVLPSGLCYGRVADHEVEALVEASERGEIYALSRLRGRTAYPSEAQAAEVMLRGELQGGRTKQLTLRALEQTAEGGVRVRFAEPGSSHEHELLVTREALPPAPQSCGAKAKPATQLIPLRARAATDSAE
jgi:hypothetical protein